MIPFIFTDIQRVTTWLFDKSNRVCFVQRWLVYSAVVLWIVPRQGHLVLVTVSFTILFVPITASFIVFSNYCQFYCFFQLLPVLLFFPITASFIVFSNYYQFYCFFQLLPVLFFFQLLLVLLFFLITASFIVFSNYYQFYCFFQLLPVTVSFTILFVPITSGRNHLVLQLIEISRHKVINKKIICKWSQTAQSKQIIYLFRK